MCFFVCISKPARHFIFADFIVHKGKRNSFFVSFLLLHFRIIQAASQTSGRCAGFKSAQHNSVFSQAVRKLFCRCQAIRTAFKGTAAYENFTSEKCSCSKNNSLGIIPGIGLCYNAFYSSFLNNKLNNFPLFHIKVCSGFYGFFHFNMITVFISLSSERVNRRSFSSIKHLALKKGFIDVYSHLSAHSIYFSNQMSLSCSTYRRVTRHHGNCFEVDRKHQGLFSHSSCCQRRFTSGVACSHNYNIIFIHKYVFHDSPPIFQGRIFQIPCQLYQMLLFRLLFHP